MRPHPGTVSVALVMLGVVALSGCAPVEKARAGEAAFSVVATTTQVADFTRNIVGEAPGVRITQLIQPNQSAHSYDPSAADLTALARADALVLNGVGLEAWLDDSVTASGFSGRTIDASSGIHIMHDGESDRGGSDHEANTPGNPHIWMDVANAESMVETIERGLASARPALAHTFHANAAAYESRLAALDAWIRANVDRVKPEDRLLVSNHDALGYFTRAYGITYVGSVIPSFDDNAEPSAADIDRLVAAIRKTGAKAVFSEASVNPKAAAAIAREANVSVYSGDDALYADSLGPTGSAGATYIGAQVHDVRLLMRSWNATSSPLPPELT